MEIFFNLFKIKYSKMSDILSEDTHVTVRSDQKVNVFINLEPIFIKMCVPRMDEYLKTNKKTNNIEFISCVVNLAAHYRAFFTKNGLTSNIYMCCPSLDVEDYRNRTFNNEYRMNFNHKFNNKTGFSALYKLIKTSIPYIQLILEYVQGVYFIESNSIENSIIPEVINHSNEDDSVNFIVTSSIYDFQYVNKDYHILIPKRDDSTVINKYSVMEYIEYIYGIEKDYNIHPAFLPFILSIVGSTHRNIYNIKGMGMKNTLKMISNAIKTDTLSPKATNIHILIDIIQDKWKKEILKNYYCTDIDTQYQQLTVKDTHDIMSQIKDKYDNVSLRKLNDRSFKEFPLLLVEITGLPGKRQRFK